MKNILILFLILDYSLYCQIEIANKKAKSYFPLVTKKEASCIYVDSTDYKMVLKVTNLLAEDIKRVTGKKPQIVFSKSQLRNNVVIIGSIDKSIIIKELTKAGKINTDPIKNQWERFLIKTTQNPFPNVKKALIIAGSDRRGTAYGVVTLSEAIGVSPWYWWADVPIKKSLELYIRPVDYVSKSPSVKYRGIFINDEDWGLKPWASYNYEKDLGDIGPKTYERVCELLLRLKGNMLAPAMHSCTGPFYSYPRNKVVADEYGIIITTSHCEPLLFNTASEWDVERDGEWDYVTNKGKILQKLENRIKEACNYENIYTMGMRGLHDEGMRGNYSKEEKVKILEKVISDQREILKKYIKKPLQKIPQIFVPYKETLELYNLGLKLPEDITIVWTDDNYGYLKRLSNLDEQKRSGGAGVYYHISYLGPPHDYLWLCTTPPVLMYEELKKAYETGANRYWLVNVGDIKPAELAIQTFFDLAWDIDSFDYKSINKHQSKFLAKIFGKKYEKVFQVILDYYYQLAWIRKPEFMGWEREWDEPQYEKLSDTEFSFKNYNDAQRRLAIYKKISDLSNKIFMELKEEYRPAFFEMVGYPVMASYQMSRKFLMAQLNHEKLEENDGSAANWAAKQAKAAFDSINSLTKIYNSLLNEKWNYIMSIPPGLCAKYQNMPNVKYIEGAGESPIDLTIKEDKNLLKDCTVINLKKYKNKVTTSEYKLQIIEGIGYDWYVIQLGKPTEKSLDPTNLNGPRFEYEFSGVNSDSVTVYVYTVPLFPLYPGKSNRFGISIDGLPTYVSKNEPKEFSKTWKDQVLRNGALTIAKLPINKNKKIHTISLICGDPGVMIQRIIIDWGGLKKSYVGPSVTMIK